MANDGVVRKGNGLRLGISDATPRALGSPKKVWLVGVGGRDVAIKDAQCRSYDDVPTVLQESICLMVLASMNMASEGESS